jgi:glycosyltransferase involved in cell wall biosynthesis
MVVMTQKHVVIDARIRRASSGRPVDRLLEYMQDSHDLGDTRYTVLLQKDDKWKPKSNNITVVRVGYKNFSFSPLQQISFSFKLYRLRADLVVFTLIGSQPLLYFKKFTMFTFDTTTLHYTRAGRLPKWAHWLRMRGYRLLFWHGNKIAKSIITISDYVKDELATMYPFTKKKTTTIYLSGDLPSEAKSEKPKKVNTPFILHVGSPFPHKNIERLVEAFGLIKNKFPDLKLVLAGKREQYTEKLEKWAKDFVYNDDIIFTGFVTDGELRWLYEHAEAYVLPSLSEGFGLPGLEAFVYGCPLVSSNATCLPEVYGDAAIYFNPKSVLDISEKTIQVLQSQSMRKRLIKRGTEQLKLYSWHKMTDETLSVIHKTLRK